MNSHDYQVGDIVTYLALGGGTRRVRVDEKDEQIKNGEPGFDGTVLGSTAPGEYPLTVWGYDRQIISVERSDG